MGFFDYLFSPKQANTQKIQFGRFSDAYKEEEKYDSWDQALVDFENKSYLDSYRNFLHYLGDDSAENLLYKDRGTHIDFKLFQGSKIVVGSISDKKILAEAKIATVQKRHIGFMRRLLEENFQLKYCRYAFDQDGNITMVFASDTVDGSPYKLYYALKELATRADKKDDVLLSEFENLKPINNKHVREISEQEVQIKYDYMHQEINTVFDFINDSKLSFVRHPGAESYLYLDLIYRIDYLIKPEGDIMEIIDKIHNLYFHDKMKPPSEKNSIIRKHLEKILEISSERFNNEIYEVKSTFGITQPSGQERIQHFIDGELKNMDWYYQNDHREVALSIPLYIIGYSLYSYSMPAPLREMCHLLYRVTQEEYFQKLGINNEKSNTLFNVRSVTKELKRITRYYGETYPEMRIKSDGLLFDNLCLFSKTYLMMIKRINFSRKDNR